MAVENCSTKLCTKCGAVKPITDYAVRTQKGRRYPAAYCRPCTNEYYKQKHAEDPSARRAIAQRYRSRNRDADRLRAAKWRSNNRAYALDALRKWKAENRDATLEYQRRYTKENLWKFRIYSRIRKSKRKMATPSWADKSRIEAIYKEAMRLGMVVDHIVPLVSKTVCGLHVEFNLRAMDRLENAKKGNRHWPDMP